MSEQHLSKGSQKPAKVDGLLRLYSMKFCPYAHRARLVLLAKNIPHDIVNINLMEKPEWYFDVHPEGKVPALDTGDKVVVESTDICDFLDELYPENPLYPSDDADKEKDKKLIEKIGPLVGIFGSCLFGQETKTASEWLEEILTHLQVFEEELSSRNTTFFGGNQPRMADYLLWPLAERSACIGIKINEKLPLNDGDLPKLRQWKKEMRKQPAVDKIYVGPERFWKIAVCKLNGTMPEYDTV